MTFTVSLNRVFAGEYQRLRPDQQDKIRQFMRLFQKVGLRDQTLYPGKLSGSWVTLAEDDPEYKRTRDACLWHYHIGLPYYTQSYAGYKTSEWLLHFQWPNWATGGTHIEIVDLYTHYKSDGQFYLPSDYRLSIYAPPPIPAAPPAQDPLPAKDRKAET
jgi:hypothetical protein